MPRLIWTNEAVLDLKRLHDFLFDKNPDAAKRAVKTIRQGAKTLRLQPQIGRPIENMASEFRDWFIGFGNSAYILRYHYDGETITVLVVKHGRELI